MAKIVLDSIEVYSFHGYSEEERKIGGKYRVDLQFEIPTEEAEKSDKLKDTVNYERIFSIVQEQMAEPSKLLEHLARKTLNAIIDEFNTIETLTISIAKLHPPIPGIMKSVSVELTYNKPR